MNGNRNRDFQAGALLKELREEMGLSREAMPHAMLRAGIPREHIPSVKTIYNVEERGQVPVVRIKFGLAQFFDREVRSIWGRVRVGAAA